MHLYYFILSVVYFYSDRPPLLKRSVALDLGGVSIYGFRIYIYIFGLPQEWSLIMLPPSTAMILKPLGTIVINIVNFKTFCDVRCTNELIDLW